MSFCDRCGKEMNISTTSRFNTQMICMNCEEKEKQHSKYAEAARRNRQAVKAGNMNFPGIGKPADL